jgi:hypothetical protein
MHGMLVRAAPAAARMMITVAKTSAMNQFCIEQRRVILSGEKDGAYAAGAM